MQPQARNEDLIVEDLGDETLVYDLQRDRAHCLNRTAALVWRACDGRTSSAALARLLHGRLPTPAPEQLVGRALQQLQRAHLLQEGTAPVSRLARCSRRDFARKLGIAIALVPVVMTVLAPSAAQAASCSPRGNGCSSDNHPCCPGLTCVNGKCV
jgi:hypothetical protein